ncbi:MAG: type III-A CRISPR-associated RAMP protein Csm4 [Thermoplasmatales archaeon]|nr:type III-A CRISPR-associated RAMP protein Csm4 [Thermoplasmatales archaeon]
MKYKVCEIETITPFHIGNKEGSLEETLHYVPSDTLFSAFCNVYRILYGEDELKKLIEEFTTKPPFLLSSAFPAVNGTLFFPTPKNSKLVSDDEILNKKLKKIEFVSEEIFKELIKEGKIEVKKEWVTVDGKGIAKEKIEKLWVEKEVARVTIDRKTNASQLYYQGEVIFNGLHFLIDLKDENYWKEIETTIRVMEHEGIGGERTYGKGLFKIKKVRDIEFNENKSEWFLTLSMYCPKKEELKGIKGYFEYITRGGWVYSPEEKGLRKKFLRMFVEGSVFNKKIVGGMVKVAEGRHDVFRYGYAFPIGVKNEI